MTDVRRRAGKHLLSSSLLTVLILTGCSTYIGTARDFDPARITSEDGWLAVSDVSHVAQERAEDCGVAALEMVLGYWQIPASRAEIVYECPPMPGQGCRAGELRDFARRKGLSAFLFRGDLADLAHELARGRPVVVGLVKPYNDGTFTHYEVVTAMHPQQGLIVTLDPARHWRANCSEGFAAEWQSADNLCLVTFPIVDDSLELP